MHMYVYFTCLDPYIEVLLENVKNPLHISCCILAFHHKMYFLLQNRLVHHERQTETGRHLILPLLLCSLKSKFLTDRP